MGRRASRIADSPATPPSMQRIASCVKGWSTHLTKGRQSAYCHPRRTCPALARCPPRRHSERPLCRWIRWICGERFYRFSEPGRVTASVQALFGQPSVGNCVRREGTSFGRIVWVLVQEVGKYEIGKDWLFDAGKKNSFHEENNGLYL